MQHSPLLDQEISFDRIELNIIDIPLKSGFQSGIGVRKTRKALIIKWQDADGRIGYGECSCRQDPYYSAEYLAGVVDMIQRFIVPNLKAHQTYRDVWMLFRKIRGWNFAKAAVESAIFQVARQESGYSLSTDLQGARIQQVPVGISLGIYTDKGAIEEVVMESIEAGYQRLKFKIAPFVDTRLFDHIRPLLDRHQVYTSFDANGSYYAKDLDAFAYFVEAFDTVIEQPFSPSRFDVLLEAKKRFPQLKICFDEELKSIGNLMKLHKLGMLDEVNLKMGRVGGLINSLEILNYCHQEEIPCWIGGMFETGIGRWLNLELASFLPHARAHDLSPSLRYFVEDIIHPSVQMQHGYVDMTKREESQVLPELIQKYRIDHLIFDCKK
ncbi:MAG: o-succinylbenzoate synthase [Bacteroidota bacterium]